MLKTYKYKLSPNVSEEILLNKHIGCCRFIYNLALETRKLAYTGNKVNLSGFDLMKQIPELRNECQWLNEVNSQSLQQSINNLDFAFRSYFNGNSKFPKFKNKLSKQSFRISQKVKVSNNKLYIPKFKNGISVILHRSIGGEIKQATISKTTTGKYYVSILCETGKKAPLKVNIKEINIVGIDLGIKTFLVASNGQLFDNPKYLRKAQNKLKYVQRKYSKYKGSRTREKIAILHERVSNKRNDFLHKASIKLVKSHDSIAIEDLNINGMLKNHNLAQSISDVSWGVFLRMLEYKAEWYGKNILKIDRFAPSSKTCSVCGSINKRLTLKDRKWICGICDSVLDRDLNASMNIKNFAIEKYLSEGLRLKNREELPLLKGVLIPEAQS